MSFLSVAHYFSQHYIHLHLVYTSGSFVLNDWILNGIVSNDWKDDGPTGSLKDFQTPPQNASRITISEVGLHTHQLARGSSIY